MSDDEITVVYDSRLKHFRKELAYNSTRKFRGRKRIPDIELKNSALKDDILNNNESKILLNHFTEIKRSSKDDITLTKSNFHQNSNVFRDDNLCKIEIIPTKDPKVHLVLSSSVDGTKSAECPEPPLQLKKIKISTSKDDHDYPTSVVNVMQGLKKVSYSQNDKLLPIITVNTSMSPDVNQQCNIPTDKEMAELSNQIQDSISSSNEESEDAGKSISNQSSYNV
ncbi:hypothetical protein Avbf_01057, partial [Armadillidium vulgare]